MQQLQLVNGNGVLDLSPFDVRIRTGTTLTIRSPPDFGMERWGEVMSDSKKFLAQWRKDQAVCLGASLCSWVRLLLFLECPPCHLNRLELSAGDAGAPVNSAVLHNLFVSSCALVS